MTRRDDRPKDTSGHALLEIERPGASPRAIARPEPHGATELGLDHLRLATMAPGSVSLRGYS